MAKAVAAKLVFLADDYAGYEARRLLGQHGLSVYVEVTDSEGKHHKVLFDTGQYGKAILHNAELLGVDLRGVDAIVLSHNHYDHTGGLLDVLKYVGKKVPVVAHPLTLRPSFHVKDGKVRNVGVPFSREELESAGADFVLVKSPREVVPRVYFLGEVERDPGVPVADLPGARTLSDDGKLVKHPMLDDTGIAVDVEGVGLVIVSGCGHSGIVNIVKQALKAVGSKPAYAMGGFHLLSLREEEIADVISSLKELGVKEVHAGHCTGLRAECMMLRDFGERFKKLHSGYTVEIKA